MTEETRDAEHGASSGPAHPWLGKYPEGVIWDKTYTAAPLYSFLDKTVSEHGDAVCTNFFGKKLTYAEIGALVNRAAAGLQKIGMRRGAKVGLFLPNCPAFVIYYFAILKAGGVVVNFNPLYTLEELRRQIVDSETDIVITLDIWPFFRKAEGLLLLGIIDKVVVCPFLKQLPFTKALLFRLFRFRQLAWPQFSWVKWRIVHEKEVLANNGVYKQYPVRPFRDTAVMQYTGGTTGTPKGALLSHANAYINVQQLLDWAPGVKDGEERVLGVLPFFHVFAMTVILNFSVAKAAEILILPRFTLDEVVQLIRDGKPTILPGVPTMFVALLNHPGVGTLDLSSVKLALSGGAALPPEVREQFQRVTGCKIIEGYGLTEASPVVTANPVNGQAKDNSIGLPLPGTHISLRDLADPAKEVAAGERGELCVKGPQVMLGYWKKPEETEAQFVGEFLKTGDVAVMDGDGYFYIVDRLKDLIICSGFNVYPRQIEDAIYTHPAVEEATVIGVPDPYRGETPKAFIKLKAGMSAAKEDILRHLAPKLSKIEMPTEIEFRESLPKTIVGKLSKKELKAEELKRREVKAP